jgi:hypothetical protein
MTKLGRLSGIVIAVVGLTSCAAMAGTDPLPTGNDWHDGWLLWTVIYYVGGILVIALPAISATDLLPDRTRRIVATAAAIVAGVVTWIQPGTRATAHERAYLCWKNARFELEEDAQRKEYKRCSDFLLYLYNDNSSTPRE